MPKIRMRSTAAGPEGVLLADHEYEVNGERATPLVSGGFAAFVGQPIERAVKHIPERRVEVPRGRR